MSTADIGDPEDLDLLAAEYVLGTLDVAERAAFAHRLRSTDAARQAVGHWERRFAMLAEGLAPVAPSDHVWTAIERALRAEGLRVIDSGRGATPPRVLPNLRRSRDRWRMGAIAASLVAVALAAVVGTTQIRRLSAPLETPADIYVAAVNRGGEKPALLVEVNLKTRTVRIRPVAAETPNGKSLELWYIDPGEKPRSLGVIDKASQTLPIPADAKGAGGAATFAVSVEPPGGSKTGGPTGPVVYSGQLVKE